MKAFRNLFIIIFSVLTLSSCYVTKTYTYSLQDEYNKEWRGSTRKEIIDNCGVPSRIVNAGGGNTILVYEDFRTSAFSVNIGGYDIGRVNNNRIYAEFYLGSNDKCYQVKTNHRGSYNKKEKVGFFEWLNYQ